MAGSAERPEVSVVVPVFQEEASIPIVFSHFLDVLGRQRRRFELIAVNDGSRDRTGELLDQVAARDARLRVIHFARNYGQTAALMAGFWAARAPLIVPLDGDGQNPPEEIERLCDELERGNYDVVSGWRKDRKDSWLRTQVSHAGELADRAHHGCAAARLWVHAEGLPRQRDPRLAPVWRDAPLYSSVHVDARGAHQGIVVQHNPRQAGQSKYGYGRIFKVAVDLILVRMLQKYRTKPMHFFGKITQWSWLATVLCFGFAVVQAIYSQNAWAAFWVRRRWSASCSSCSVASQSCWGWSRSWRCGRRSSITPAVLGRGAAGELRPGGRGVGSPQPAGRGLRSPSLEEAIKP